MLVGPARSRLAAAGALVKVTASTAPARDRLDQPVAAGRCRPAATQRYTGTCDHLGAGVAPGVVTVGQRLAVQLDRDPLAVERPGPTAGAPAPRRRTPRPGTTPRAGRPRGSRRGPLGRGPARWPGRARAVAARPGPSRRRPRSSRGTRCRSWRPPCRAARRCSVGRASCSSAVVGQRHDPQRGRVDHGRAAPFQGRADLSARAGGGDPDRVARPAAARWSTGMRFIASPGYFVGVSGADRRITPSRPAPPIDRERHVGVVQAAPRAQAEHLLVQRAATVGISPRLPTIPRREHEGAGERVDVADRVHASRRMQQEHAPAWEPSSTGPRPPLGGKRGDGGHGGRRRQLGLLRMTSIVAPAVARAGRPGDALAAFDGTRWRVGESGALTNEANWRSRSGSSSTAAPFVARSCATCAAMACRAQRRCPGCRPR